MLNLLSHSGHCANSRSGVSTERPRERSGDLIVSNDNFPLAPQAGGAADRGGIMPRAEATPDERRSLFSMYARWFDVLPADTPERLDEAYKLRYQVYCVENQFEPPDSAQHGRETDDFDRHSVHSLLIHRPTGMVAGTVRLILPVDGRGIDALPISACCTEPSLRDPARFPPARTAEISRFAVSKAFRRRITDATYPDMHVMDGAPRSEERRVGKSVDLGGRRIIEKKKMQTEK